MKDTRRISDRVEKLAKPPAGAAAGREVAPGPDGGALAAILREVDETVLPRTLVFRRGGATLKVSAGNRRLLSIDALDGAAVAVAAEVLGQPLTQPDIGFLGKLRETLASGLRGGGPITVIAEPPGKAAADFAAGTTAAALASVWGVDLAPAPSDPAPRAAPQAPFDAFLDTANARAWLRLASGSIQSSGGDADLRSRLRDFADSADFADLDMATSGETRRFIAIGRAPDDGDFVLFVSDRSDAAFLIIPPESLDKARNAWAAAKG